jgi:hypothetical protein
MTLAAGTRLGPYEILAQIGEGGMGEVYKARDTRLDRIVAIKVLPPHLALNAEMRDRFQREAHAIASLQHPNICVLYDIGEQDGLHYLVMEYLEGETLALRLLKGLLPLDQVLRYAIEISDALDKAHRQGYTHRDIKPANIMLTKSGSKILDFGLAKLKPPITRTDIPFSEMPTPPPGSPLPPGYGPDSLTADGTILGTIFYMAPEQLEGKADDVDGRADIFSFGAMVYEMLTGKRAFAGKSQASVIASILKDEPPPMSTLQPPEKMTPPALDRLVKKCLAKDRDRRWQAASDVCDELKWIAEGGSQAGVAVTAQSVAPRKGRERVLAGVALLAIVTAVVLAVVTFRRTPVPEAERMLFSISTPGTPSIATGAFSVSPDGLKLAFVAPDSAGNDALWFRSLDSLTTRPLSGTEGAIDPFWSPDSRFVAFYSASKLNKVEISSGSVQTLTDAAARGGGAWNRDGVILFAPQINGGLAQVSETGGAASPLTTLDSSRQEIFHRFPQFLPDRRHFIYVVHSNQPDNDGIYLGSLDSKETRQLLKGGNAARYTPPDYLLFMRESGLMAQHLDPERLELTGEPVLVAQQVSTQGMSATGAVNFSVSETGLLAYANAEELSIQLGWFDRSGRALGLAGTLSRRKANGRSPGVFGSRSKRRRLDHGTGQRNELPLHLRSGAGHVAAVVARRQPHLVPIQPRRRLQLLSKIGERRGKRRVGVQVSRAEIFLRLVRGRSFRALHDFQ